MILNKPFIYLSIHPSIRPSLRPFVPPSIRPSITCWSIFSNCSAKMLYQRGTFSSEQPTKYRIHQNPDRAFEESLFTRPINFTITFLSSLHKSTYWHSSPTSGQDVYQRLYQMSLQPWSKLLGHQRTSSSNLDIFPSLFPPVQCWRYAFKF